MMIMVKVIRRYIYVSIFVLNIKNYLFDLFFCENASTMKPPS